MTVRYLGNEGYGLMVTITSVVGWLQFSNMGLGLGLQNALTEEAAHGNLESQRELVSTAVFALAGIGLLLGLVGAVVFPFVDWLKIFPPSTPRFAGEIYIAVGVVYFGFVSTVVLSFVAPIFAARQELHLYTVQSVLTALGALGGVLMVIRLDMGLVGIVVATVGSTALIQWGYAGWTLYGRDHKELRPRLAHVTRAAWRRMFNNGIQFFLIHLCNIVFYQVDAMLIMHFISADGVTPYNVAQKIFLQFGGIFAIVTSSLWSAYGHAKAQGDFRWIQRTHSKMIRMFLLFFGLIALGAVLAGRPVLAWWVGPDSAPTIPLLAAVAFYFCLREWTALHAMLLNGLNMIRQQIPALVCSSVVAIGLEIYLVRRFGAVGIAVGGGLGFLVSGWYLTQLTRQTFARMGTGTPPTAKSVHTQIGSG